MAKKNELRVVDENFSVSDEVDGEPKDEIQTAWTSVLDLLGAPIDYGTGIPLMEQDLNAWSTFQPPPEAAKWSERTPKAADMSTPTREEFDARLREIATQAENRALRTDNKIDEMLRRLEARDAVQDERLKNLADKLQTVASDTTATRDSIGSLKMTIITTVIATGLAITALIYTLNTSLFTAFESGKTTASALADASNKLTQVTERLDAMSKQTPTPSVVLPASTPAAPKQ